MRETQMSISVWVNYNRPYMSSHISITGANPSAEEQEEDLDDGPAKVNNVVYSGRLQPTTFDKKSYTVYLKVN